MGRKLAFAALAVVALLLASFAMPVREWRRGELPAPPLAVVEGGPAVAMPRRFWVDTDAACGHGERTDPDDCLALLLLARAPGVEIAGVSAVQGNAPLEVTSRTTREAATLLGLRKRSIFDLPGALAEPLTILALGPLTNIAAVLEGRPDLQRNVARIVAVMGRRPGHLFHPSEGAGGGMLFGHGPVFSDFNFEQDRDAAARILAMGLPMTLVPYEAARHVALAARDVEALAATGGAARWVAERSRSWLRFWREEVGRDGFYPFDALAAAYALRPELFDCAIAGARVAEDEKLWGRWGLLVGPERGHTRIVYCPRVNARLHEWLMAALQL
jgi:inosine-uridine nucleoside N-ribohydrolase